MFGRILAAAFLIGALTGCAALNAAGARHQVIRSSTADHVYKAPLPAVWPEARQLLFEKGYEVRDTGESAQRTLETEWKYEEGARTRYLVQGIDVDGRTSRVRFSSTRQVKTTNGTWTSGIADRDLWLEWELLRRVDPTAAAEIQARADNAAAASRAAH
jgi:hypothetical protein